MVARHVEVKVMVHLIAEARFVDLARFEVQPRSVFQQCHGEGPSMGSSATSIKWNEGGFGMTQHGSIIDIADHL